ncbi:MAG: M23 family metallopeptidase [Patescibacteria group bacterium]|nr:M23 family metallopeptidase [Patescibacteria group bacterium]
MKNLIAATATTIIKPFFWLGKFLLYRPFVRLYYLIFRVKKYDLGQQSKRELINKKSLHLTALILIIAAIILNLSDKKQASAAVGKAPKSLMAEIVKNEFSDIGQNNDELVEEKAQNSNLQALGAEKYLGGRGAVSVVKSVSPISEEDINLAKNTGNMLTKPKQITIINNNTDKPAENNTPATRQEITDYTVRAGDTISSIARRFSLNVNTILWANNLNAFSIIRAGDKLTILPTDGFLYKVVRGDTIGKIAQTYDVSTEKIIASNSLGAAGTIAIGQQLIIPGVKKTTSSATASTGTQSSHSGIAVIKDIISSDKPIVSSNKMLWPTEGHRITQYFSWQHNGLDIANKVGTPIYAADDGVVEISQGGYNGGYGNTILINHGGGKKTRYGHASKLLVKKGETVTKGQLIALMGSTGRSTGPHLHFEVVINGVRYNPLNYIK